MGLVGAQYVAPPRSPGLAGIALSPPEDRQPDQVGQTGLTVG